MKKTSIKANMMAEQSGLKVVHYKKILQAMKRYKVNHPNYQQIAKVAGLEPVQVARRLSEMVGKGLIIEAEKLSKTISGRVATTYKIAA